MKNGINVAATSELFHEVSAEPAQGLFRFQVHVAAQDAHELASVGTIHLGTLRVARDFCAESEPHAAGRQRPSPVDYLLTALGGCVMASWAQGCSVRGITLSKLSVRVFATLPPPGQGLGLQDVGYHVDIESTGSSQQAVDLGRAVSCFSPIHRTLLEANEPTVEVRPPPPNKGRAVRYRPHVLPRAAANHEGASGPTDRVQAELIWHYGTHFGVRMSDPASGRSWDADLDQPKQFGGLDRAPNPQEFALIALGGDLLGQLRQHAAHGAAQGIAMRGDVDVRGCLNTGLTEIVGLHNLQYGIEYDGALAPEALQQSLKGSVAYQTVVRPTPLQVLISANGEQVLDMRSDLEVVRRILKDIGAPNPKATQAPPR